MVLQSRCRQHILSCKIPADNSTQDVRSDSSVVYDSMHRCLARRVVGIVHLFHGAVGSPVRYAKRYRDMLRFAPVKLFRLSLRELSRGCLLVQALCHEVERHLLVSFILRMWKERSAPLQIIRKRHFPFQHKPRFQRETLHFCNQNCLTLYFKSLLE